MQTYTIQTQGICPGTISFSMEDGKIYNVKFLGGCPGNTLALSKLLEGYDAKKAIQLLKGNDCGGRGTSCADKLVCGVEQAMSGALATQNA